MLQQIRERFTGFLAGVIIVTIAVALTITLVNTDPGAVTGNFAARVNGEEIALTDYRQVYQSNLLQQQETTRSELSPEATEQLQRDVLEGMVRNRVVAQYVRERGYRVSDARVLEFIRGLEVFHADGKFSPERYQAALSGRGISPTAFENEQRAALEIQQLQNGILDSAFFTPAEYRRFVALETERRSVAYVLIEARQLQAGVSVSEQDLQSYYDAHPDQFELPETVALDYVEARLADVGAETAVDEGQLRALYEENPDRYRTAEQRHARHILIAVDGDTDIGKAEQLATGLRRRLDRGEDFAALARQVSDDPGSAAGGGDLGWAGRDTYAEAFETALFALRPGEISAPVRTEFGYHIIQLLEVRPPTQRSFEEVRAELLQEAGARGAQDRYFALTERMDDAALENPGSLDAVARATGLTVQHVDEFTRSGGGPFGPDRAVIEAAFSPAVLEDGENSPLIEVGEGQAVILRVAEHRPARLRPLLEIRDQVEAAVRNQKAAALAATRGAEMLKRAREGADLAQLSREFGLSLVTPPPLGRGSSEVSPELLAAVFRAAKPAQGEPVFNGTALPDGSFAVYRLGAVAPGRPEDIPREQRDARKTLLARQTGAAETTALAMDLRGRADIVVAPDLFEQQEAF